MDETLTSALGERSGPVCETDGVGVADDLVRGYYRAWERQERLLRVDRSWLGLAVLMDLGFEFWVGVSA